MAKIMLVEDDNNLREIYGARLLAEGHEIVTAKDGEEALATAVKEKPDLIISDVMMPRISGFDMLDILRNAPETKFTKVIMMTALSQAEDKARASNLGADRYLVKSQVTLEDVARVVKDVLDGKTEAESSAAPIGATADEPAETTAQPDPITPPAEPAPAVAAEPAPVVEPTPVVATPEVIPVTEPVVSNPTPVTPDPVVVAPVEPLVTPPAQDSPEAAPVVVQSEPVAPTPPEPAPVVEPTPVVATPEVIPVTEPVVSNPTPVTPDPVVVAPVVDPVAPVVQDSPTPTPVVVQPDPITPPAEPAPAVAADPTPAISVQLPQSPTEMSTPTDASSVANPGNVIEPSGTPDATTESTQSFVGPNLAEALQAEESASQQESAPSATPDAPSGIALPDESPVSDAPVEPVLSAPELPTDPAAPSVAATNPAAEPETNPVDNSEAEDSAPNPLNDDSKKKLVIQPLHDLNSVPDLNALLEKENAAATVTNPSMPAVVQPQMVGNEISAPPQNNQNSPQQPSQHDIISI